MSDPGAARQGVVTSQDAAPARAEAANAVRRPVSWRPVRVDSVLTELPTVSAWPVSRIAARRLDSCSRHSTLRTTAPPMMPTAAATPRRAAALGCSDREIRAATALMSESPLENSP